MENEKLKRLGIEDREENESHHSRQYNYFELNVREEDIHFIPSEYLIQYNGTHNNYLYNRSINDDYVYNQECVSTSYMFEEIEYIIKKVIYETITKNRNRPINSGLIDNITTSLRNLSYFIKINVRNVYILNDQDNINVLKVTYQLSNENLRYISIAIPDNGLAMR